MKKIEVGIVGGGLMGAGIAQVFAVAGYEVIVFEPNADVRASLAERVSETLRLVGDDISSVQRIKVTDDLEQAVSSASYVTEAAPERLALKQAIFADLVRLAPRDCILASNTSVMPITGIVGELETADRMVGTHWWNPPFLIPLVEVVQAEKTSDETISRTMEILTRIGKSPAHVRRDTPGFVANRLQHALWREAIAMVAEGVCDPQTLDACVKNSFGLRLPVLGPLENADLVGLDLTLDIHRTMMPELDVHKTPNAFLETKVEKGDLGFKTGAGFRTWSEIEMKAVREGLIAHLLKAKDAR
jgi:3-hydroxybutyryl-CoA dehydrogenase